MEVQGGLIWGDDIASEVFAQAHNIDLYLIFRFAMNRKFPRGLPSRIVTCYHDLPANDANETFPDRASMREALYSSIRRVWPQCTLHPSIAAVDAAVEIHEDTEGHDQWRVSHESIYKLYIESLLPIDCLLTCKEAKPRVYDFVDYSSLVYIRHLGGRGNTTVVRRSLSSDALYVFKGVDFGVFLESPADFRHRKDICYHEIRAVCSLPKHPNIIPRVRHCQKSRGPETGIHLWYPISFHGAWHARRSGREEQKYRNTSSIDEQSGMVLSDGFSYFSLPFYGTYISHGHQTSQFCFGCQERLDFDRLGTERGTIVYSRTRG
jgi:hypothetical protein